MKVECLQGIIVRKKYVLLVLTLISEVQRNYKKIAIILTDSKQF